MQRVGRQFETIGPCQRPAFDERAREIGGICERARHYGIARDQVGCRPIRNRTIGEGKTEDSVPHEFDFE